MSKDTDLVKSLVEDLYICSIQPCSEPDVSCSHRKEHLYGNGCDTSCNTGGDKCIPVEPYDVICDKHECPRFGGSGDLGCQHSIRHKKNEDCYMTCSPGGVCIPFSPSCERFNKYLIAKNTAKATRYHMRNNNE